MFTRLPAKIGLENPAMTSLPPSFVSCRKKNFENSQKIEVSTKYKYFLRNLTQCCVKIYSGPKKCLGLIGTLSLS